jgi:DNA-directed RNA polymerase subunit beta
VAAIAPSRAPRQRRSYARLNRVIDVPNLIDIQVASFRRFMEEGLREVIDDISPIEDYTGTLAVEFGEYAFDPPPVSIRE